MLGVLASLAAREAKARAAAALRRALMMALAAMLALMGAGFLLAAGFIAAAEAWGAQTAALAFGGGFLVLAGLVVLIAHSATPRRGIEIEALAALDHAPQALRAALAKSPGLSLAAAFAGGVLLALKLRR